MPQRPARRARADRRHRGGQAGQQRQARADRRAGRLRRQRRHLARTLDWAAPAASASPATSSGPRCAGWSTSPSAAPRSTRRCRTSTRRVRHREPRSRQGGAEPLWAMSVGGLRLPLVEVDDAERDDDPRDAGRATGCSRRQPRVERQRAALRVLPLGGLGEIGKNMTVVEYDDRIVVVDCGLRFPTAEMMGIDLVLPDFTYLRERVDDIEAIVITHGHEDHLGALPWVLRELGQDERAGGLRRPADDGDGALQARRAQAARRRPRRRCPAASRPRPGRSTIELIHMTHSIPDASRRRAAHRARDRAGHRRLQVRPDAGRRPAGRRLAARRARARGPAAAVRRLDERRPPRLLAQRVARRAATSSASFARCEGRIVVTCFASNIHRVQQVVDAAAALGPQGRARRALDAQERQHRPHARAHRRARGDPRRAARARATSPTTSS